ncbi:MAG: hypothetical protein CMJ81_17405 [Planctomycetaceae bacterium]|nr:hypothetical protein [Planctomycetaceae bacterium]
MMMLRIHPVSALLATLALILVHLSFLTPTLSAAQHDLKTNVKQCSGCDKCESRANRTAPCNCSQHKCYLCNPGKVICHIGNGELLAHLGSPVEYGEPASTGPDLFYNFYNGPTGGATYSAAMYPSPNLTPPVTGYSYYTYQPVMPHEYMYRHKRKYHHYYNGNRGLNKTTVSYSPNRLQSLRAFVHWVLEPPR